MTNRTALLTLAALLVATIAATAAAKNVDLSTVPKRNTVQLTIYNSEDLTLVRETRAVTFKKGVNPLQFSWANTLIDPSSVRLRFLSHAEKLDVLDTTFPHDKPQMLYWNVQSDFDGEAMLEITYFTSGISWAADYTLVADKDEKELKLESFVKVTNNSGEEYENAEVRLVVGTINLVEKIAQLAHLPMGDVAHLEDDAASTFKLKAALDVMAKSAAAAPAPEPSIAPMEKEKQIIKEGLSEYFIYTIEGTETIPNGWSKRLRSLETSAIPLKVQYRYRPAEYGDELVRMYLMTNDKPSKLGTTPLPNGAVRVFRDNGRGGLSFLASQEIKYIPIGDKIELNLGHDPNVLFDLVKLRALRDNIWMQLNGLDVYRKVGQPGVAIEVNSAVAGWDEHEVYTQRIRNFTPRPIEVEVRRPWPGDITFRSQLNPTLFDYLTPQFTTTVGTGEKKDLLFEIVRRQGHNAKQNNVTLEAAEAQ